MLKKVLAKDFRNTSVDEITQKINGSDRYRLFSRVNNVIIPAPEDEIKTYRGDIKLENGERSGVKDRTIDCVRFNLNGERETLESDLVVRELNRILGFGPSSKPRIIKKEEDTPFVCVSYYVLNGDRGWYKVDRIGLRVFSSATFNLPSSMLEEYVFGAR